MRDSNNTTILVQLIHDVHSDQVDIISFVPDSTCTFPLLDIRESYVRG
jgi:hypothetical protein